MFFFSSFFLPEQEQMTGLYLLMQKYTNEGETRYGTRDSQESEIESKREK